MVKNASLASIVSRVLLTVSRCYAHIKRRIYRSCDAECSNRGIQVTHDDRTDSRRYGIVIGGDEWKEAERHEAGKWKLRDKGEQRRLFKR